ncbi:flagellar hook-basal body complex protein [Zobellella denitrificans]
MSYSIGLSGLRATNQSLGVISHNIANVSTAGFKSARAEFAAVYGGGQPGGVEVNNVSQNFERDGDVVNTGRSLDLAISGNGFFMTSLNGQTAYTRAGTFNRDADNFIVANNGMRLQGYMTNAAGQLINGVVQDLRVDVANLPAKASTRLDFVANLKADATVPANAFDPDDATSYNFSQSSELYDSLGTRHILTQYFAKMPGTASTQLDFAANLDAGAAIPANVFAPTDASSYNFSQSSTLFDSRGNSHVMTQYFVKTGADTWEAHYYIDGNAVGSPQNVTFNPDGSLASPGSLTLEYEPAGATKMTIALDQTGMTQHAAGFNVTLNQPDGDPNSNSWEVNYRIDGNAVGGAQALTFNTDGTLATPAGNITLNFAPAGADAMTVTLNPSRLTQFAADFNVSRNQPDGHTAGELAGVRFESNGDMYAVFTNGQDQLKGKVVMANFANPNGLRQGDDTSWYQSFASGAPAIGEPGTGTLGSLTAGAYEGSNVELTGELVNLMTAQRNYQANSKSISTADKMTQVLFNSF